MRILSLRLKNFKGIKNGLLKKDEIFLDLSSLPSGLIAIAGENGAGKTTVIDNLHPYRVMPFRGEQGLADAVYGNAEKELIFSIAGQTYKSLLEINGKDRGQTAYLSVLNSDNTWTSITDGRTGEYDEAIERLVMPEKLFFLANFRAQNARSFNGYKKSELKEVFEKLIGLEHLLEISGRAKEKRQAAEGLIREVLKEKEVLTDLRASLSVEIAAFNPPAIGFIERETAEIENLRRDYHFIGEQLLKVQARLSEAETKQKSMTEQRSSDQKALARKNTQIAEDILQIDGKLKQLTGLLDIKSDIEQAVKKTQDLRIELDAVREKITEKQKFEDKKKSEEQVMASLDRELAVLERSLKEKKKAAEVLEEVPCGEVEKSQCKLLTLSIEAAKNLPDEEKAVQAKLSSSAAALENIAAIEARLTVFPENLSKKKEDISMSLGKAETLALKAPIVAVAEEQARALKEQRIRLTTVFEEEQSELRDRIAHIETSVDSLNQEVRDTKTHLTLIMDSRSALDKQIESRTKALNDILFAVKQFRKAEDQAAGIDEKILKSSKILAAGEKELAQWRLLERGFGHDGLVAFELEYASPAITDITNSLLMEMGGRFNIRLETLRPKKGKPKGGAYAKEEYTEVFDIRVIDTDTGEEKSLVDLSGGERVWIDDAIARGIGVYLARTTNSHVETIVSDERDGALDEEKKREYCAMKRKVLEIGGFRQEFFISHTPELWDAADAVITIGADGISLDCANSFSLSLSGNKNEISVATPVPEVVNTKEGALSTNIDIKDVKKAKTRKPAADKNQPVPSDIIDINLPTVNIENMDIPVMGMGR